MSSKQVSVALASCWRCGAPVTAYAVYNVRFGHDQYAISCTNTACMLNTGVREGQTLETVCELWNEQIGLMRGGRMWDYMKPKRKRGNLGELKIYTFNLRG